MSGFRKFLLRGNVIDLAVAVVIGAAFATLVQVFVKGFLTPLIGVMGGLPDFSQYAVEVNSSRFLIGEFVNAVIAFLMIAAVLYFFVVAPYAKLVERFTPEPTPPQPTKECPHCLSKVPEKATRCAFCTSDLAAQGNPVS